MEQEGGNSNFSFRELVDRFWHEGYWMGASLLGFPAYGLIHWIAYQAQH